MLQMVGADPTRARDALATVSTSTNSHVTGAFKVRISRGTPCLRP